MRSCQGGGSPGVGSWSGSSGRMASQRKSSTKLGMSKRRSAAGMERVSASSEREGLCKLVEWAIWHGNGWHQGGSGNQELVHRRLLWLRCQARFSERACW